MALWALTSLALGAPAQAATLRELADKIGLNMGVSLQCPLLAADSVTYKEVAAREYNMTVPGVDMKMDHTEPVEGEFHFELADTLMAYSKRNGMKVRGHTLVWWNASPDWAQTPLPSRTRLLGILKTHIDSVMTHFKGRITEWDVVNEPIMTSESDDLRSSFWRKSIGPDYIDSAFVYAHRADPDARLVINEFNTEDINNKSTALYDLVSKLKGKGIPIQEVGFQCHIKFDDPASMFTGLEKNLKRFSDLGVDVAITELDVAIDKPIQTADYQKQATAYAQCLRACLRTPRCKTFTMWGFTDAFSWIPNVHPTQDDALIFDRNYQPKPAYYALQKVLDSAAAASGVLPRAPHASTPDIVPTAAGFYWKGEPYSPLDLFSLKGDRVASVQEAQGLIRYDQLSLKPGIYWIKAHRDGQSVFQKILVP